MRRLTAAGLEDLILENIMVSNEQMIDELFNTLIREIKTITVNRTIIWICQLCSESFSSSAIEYQSIMPPVILAHWVEHIGGDFLGD